jgi:SAM-dependent methyltransferase
VAGELTQNQPSSREWNSDVYHRLSGPQVSWGKKVLSRLRLRGDEAVLDAGCGTGRLTAELLDALPRGRVVGIDLSQNMLRSAREHLAQFKPHAHLVPNLVLCDLSCLPFVACFDGIVSTAAFHWVLDHDRLFANLRRALVPGGWLEAQCGGGPNVVACANVRTNWLRLRNLLRSSRASVSLGFFRMQSVQRRPFYAPGSSKSRPRSKPRPRSSTVPDSTASLCVTLFCGGIWRTFHPNNFGRNLWQS